MKDKEDISYKEACKKIEKIINPPKTIIEKIKDSLLLPFLLVIQVLYGIIIFFISDYLLKLIFNINIEYYPKLRILFFVIIFWISVFLLYRIINKIVYKK